MHGKVLLLSQRRISDLVAFCLAYEFEDAFAAVTDAERIDATDLSSLEFSRRGYKLARLATGSPGACARLAPSPRSKVVLDTGLRAVLSRSSPTPSNCIRWRRSPTGASAAARRRASSPKSGPTCCRNICSSYCPSSTTSSSGCATASTTWRASPAAPAATCRSRPTCCVSRRRRDQQRPIDVCNIGRRSQVTHQALLETPSGGRASTTTTRWPRAAPT